MQEFFWPSGQKPNTRRLGNSAAQWKNRIFRQVSPHAADGNGRSRWLPVVVKGRFDPAPVWKNQCFQQCWRSAVRYRSGWRWFRNESNNSASPAFRKFARFRPVRRIWRRQRRCGLLNKLPPCLTGRPASDWAGAPDLAAQHTNRRIFSSRRLTGITGHYNAGGKQSKARRADTSRHARLWEKQLFTFLRESKTQCEDQQ